MLLLDKILFYTWRILFARREVKTRIQQCDWLAKNIRREKVENLPTFTVIFLFARLISPGGKIGLRCKITLEMLTLILQGVRGYSSEVQI